MAYYSCDDLAVAGDLTIASQVFGSSSNSHPEDLFTVADRYLSLSTYTPDNENGGLTGVLITKLGNDGFIDQSFGSEGSMTVYYEGFVNDVNEAPDLQNDTATVSTDENISTSAVIFDADATDQDGDDLTYYPGCSGHIGRLRFEKVSIRAT